MPRRPWTRAVFITSGCRTDLSYERYGLSSDTLGALRAMGHELDEGTRQGVAEVIVYDATRDVVEGGLDRRQPDGSVGVE